VIPRDGSSHESSSGADDVRGRADCVQSNGQRGPSVTFWR
jgi:hypothetical protein